MNKFWAILGLNETVLFVQLYKSSVIFWDLRLALFDIPKDVVFAETQVFSSNFGFAALNSAPKWNKTLNFGCLTFKLKFKILKDFSNTAFALLETLFSGQNFSKIEKYLGE